MVCVQLWMTPAGGLVVDADTPWHALAIDGLGYRLRVQPDRLLMADVPVVVPAPLGYVVSPLTSSAAADGWVGLNLIVTRCAAGKRGNFLCLCPSREWLALRCPTNDAVFRGRVVLPCGGGLWVYDFELCGGGRPSRFFMEETDGVGIVGGADPMAPVKTGSVLSLAVGEPFRLSQSELAKPLHEVVGATGYLTLEPAWGQRTATVVRYLASSAAGLGVPWMSAAVGGVPV